MSEKGLFLHLGLPKAASSYLQLKIFPKLQGIYHYPKPYFKRFPEILERAKGGRYLFSTEMFGRLCHRAKKIAQGYPDAGIILVLRRQDRWIRSKYKYYIWKSGTMDFREFFDIHSDEGYWKKKALYYRPILDTLVARFQHPPLLLFQEDLEEDPGPDLERLQQYTGTRLAPEKIRKKPLKVSFNDNQLILLRAFNKRFPYRKPQSWPRLLKQLHMHLRQGVNYLVAWSALLFPSSYFKDKALLSKADLEAIRSFYEGDFLYCRKWAEERKEVQVERDSEPEWGS
ncbi:MAG: hypothetical protein ABEH38_01690 [Flavobacteriales bacterium]